MKKLLFFLGLGLFLFFILSFLLIFLNLNKILNKPYFSQKLEKFLQNHYQISIKYDRVDVKLFQGKINVKNFYFKSKFYRISVPDGHLKFSFSKFLKFKFSPVKIEASNIKFEKYFKKKVFNLKKCIHTFHKLSPLYLSLTNSTIKYETKYGWFNFKNTNLKLNIDKNQVLYEFKAKSNFFEDGNIKGRFNYKNKFWENLIDLKNINIANFQKLSKHNIAKIKIKRIKSEIVFEKDTLNIAFVSLDPYIFIKKNLSQKLLGGYIEGIIVANKKKLEITLNSIKLKYPQIIGTMYIKKDRIYKLYKLTAKVKEVNIFSIKDVFLKLFPENKSIKKVFRIVKGGKLYNLDIKGQSRSFKTLFNIKNLNLKSSVSGGNIELAFLPFTIRDIKGELIYKKHNLYFSGNAFIDKKIKARITNLELKFFKKKPYLNLKGIFEGEAKLLKSILIRFSPKLSKLYDYNFKGWVKGEIDLRGYASKSDLKGNIKIYLDNLLIKLPYYKNLVIVKKGSITYDFNTLKFQNLYMFTKNAQVFDLNFILYLKSLNFDLISKNATISKKFVYEIIEKFPKIKTFFSKYAIDFQKINIEFLKLESNLKEILENKSRIKDILEKRLFLKGAILSAKSKYPFKGKIFKLKVSKLPFEFNKGIFYIKETTINIDDSIFDIKGLIKGYNNINIKGNGEIYETLGKKLEVLWGLPSGYSLKKPITISYMELNYTPQKFVYLGECNISKNHIKIQIQRDENFSLNLIWQNYKTAFEINFIKNCKNFLIKASGEIDLKDINSMFEDLKYKFKGKLKTFLNLSFSTKIKKLNTLSKAYLNNLIVLSRGYLKLFNTYIKISNNKTLNINLLSNFNGKEISVSNFSIRWDGSLIKGNMKIDKTNSYFKITGSLRGEDVDLRKIVSKKEIEKKKSIQDGGIRTILKSIPFVADLDIFINNLILPTAHYIENIQGEIFVDNLNKLLIINIPKANFCELNLTAMYEKSLHKQDLYVEILPSKGDFLDLFSCLYPKEMPTIILEGPFYMRGYVYINGDATHLLRKTTGEIEIKGKKGYIYRAPLLARLFGFLSPIDIFRGKIPNLENNLLEYEELNIQGKIGDPTFELKKAFLSATGFRLFGTGKINLLNKKMNLIFYVSPFKTLDMLLEKFPYLGKKILGEQRMLIYLPLEVSGTYDNYKIIPLHPSSVGKGIFDFIFRMLNVPEEFYKNKPKIKKYKKNKYEYQKSPGF